MVTWFIWLVVVIAIIVFAGMFLRILEGAAKIAVSILLVIIVIGGGFWVLNDINKLKNHFYQDEKLFILDIDDGVVGAFTLAGDGVTRPINDLTSIQSDYPDLEALQGDSYKVVVMDWDVVAGDLVLDEVPASDDEIRAALLSDNPRDLAVDKAVERLGPAVKQQVVAQVHEIYPTDDAFSSTLFAMLAEEPLANAQKMNKGFRNGEVSVYPETVTFKIMKILPIANLIFPEKK